VKDKPNSHHKTNVIRKTGGKKILTKDLQKFMRLRAPSHKAGGKNTIMKKIV